MNEYRYSIYQSTKDLWGIPTYEVDAWIIKSSNEDKKSNAGKHTVVSLKPIPDDFLYSYGLSLHSHVTLERQRNELLKKSSLSENQKMTIVFMTFDNLDEVKKVIVKMEG